LVGWETVEIHRREYDASEAKALEGLRVLDMSRLVAGNMCSLQLADFGAEVVKVEHPGRGDTLRDWKDGGVSVFWKVYGRNKKSISLNLKSPESVEIIKALLPQFNVVLESFRFGYLEQIGLGPDVLHAINPDLVILRISGFGQTGPYRGRPAFGTLAEAMSGFAARNGFEDREPVLPPLAIGDMVAGLYGAMSVLVATRAREQKGAKGQVIDLSLLESIFSILGPEAAFHKITGGVRKRLGSASEAGFPRNVYPTRDGCWIAVSASTQASTESLFRAIGRADWNADEEFRTATGRAARRQEIDDAVRAHILGYDLADALDLLQQGGVAVSPIYDISQFVRDPHVVEREIVVELPDDDTDGMPMHNVLPRLSGTPGGIRTPAPAIGEHNAEIYQRIGFDTEALADLRERGVI
jgi:crotonobetainyl-CoA:carnitine CoA-transferase CaiB-like acyl-CoA transferase